MRKVLAVVAHHDDAQLWMGGAIYRMKQEGWDWTVIAMCVPDQQLNDYFNKWSKACKITNIAMDFNNHGDVNPFGRNVFDKMKSRLADSVNGRKFDYVFTHSRSRNGEYGLHSNHSEVLQVVNSLVHEGKLGVSADRVAYFAYFPLWLAPHVPTVIAMPNASYYFHLNYRVLLFKCIWCLKAPDVQNLRNLRYPCPNPEAFEGDGLQLPQPFVPRDL